MAGFHGHVRLAEGTASGCGNATGHFQQAVLPWASPRTGLLLDADRGAALFSLNGAFQGGCRLPQRPMWRAAMACVSTRYLRNDLQLIICSCDSPTITHYRRGFRPQRESAVRKKNIRATYSCAGKNSRVALKNKETRAGVTVASQTPASKKRAGNWLHCLNMCQECKQAAH